SRQMKTALHSPGQQLIEPAPELQVVRGVNDAVAVEIEEGQVAAAGGFIKGGAERQVVAGVDHGLEICAGRAAGRRARSARVAEEAMERRRLIGGHVDAGDA